MRKVWIALVHDWELRGNGLGNVIELQHKPAIRLKQLHEKLGITGTFNIEVMQQLAFLKYAKKYSEIENQARVWNDTVLLLHRGGFDIQLHIHPQWHNAEYDGHFWKLDKRWNIVDYSPEQIDQFVSLSIDYLHSILPHHPILSFRGGSWGVCCPSRPLFEALEKYGIKIDISIIHGMYYDGESIKLDYTHLDSPYFPYYPDYDDVRRLSFTKTGIVEIPTQSVLKRDVSSLSQIMNRALQKIMSRALQKTDNTEQRMNKSANALTQSLPDHIIQDPFGYGSGVEERCYILGLSQGQSFSLWKKLLDIVMNRALSTHQDLNFLVFENHPKDLINEEHFAKIEKIILYLQKKYGTIVEFVTLRQMAENVQSVNPLLGKSHA